MPKNSKQSFFTKNGKALKGFINENLSLIQTPKENIESLILFDVPQEPSFKKVFAHKISKVKNKLRSIKYFEASFIKKTWITTSYAAFSMAALIVALYPMKVIPNINHRYSIYASTPLQLGSTDYKIYARDARSQKINQVFKQYNCPLEGLGEVFVYEADKHNIPWWLVAAVSFQESSCGKLTPEPKGIESYNAWGWGVYGDNVQSFDNWARGIETVSEYFNKRFFSKGITEPCEIMKTYTPPSKGSWCEGVKHFGDLMQNYKSPDAI
jgi:hypothetical protein